MAPHKIIPLTPNNMQVEGHAPIHAVPLEEAVLGAVLLESTRLVDAADIIRSAEFFYKPAHQHIWQAIADLQARNMAIDMETLVAQLKRNGKLEAAGGMFYLAQLSNKVGSAENIASHARILAEAYIKRSLQMEAMNMIYRAVRDDVDAFDALGMANAAIDRINQILAGYDVKDWRTTVLEVGQEMLDMADGKKEMMGIPTGLHAVDRQLLGFQPGDHIVLGGRPAMGKTGFALGIAINQAWQMLTKWLETPQMQRKQISEGIGFFSLEMSDKQLIRRELAKAARKAVNTILRGQISPQDRQRLAGAIIETSELPFFMHDEGGIDITRVCAIITGWVRKHGVKVVYIDYLQLITVTGRNAGNREQEISTISRALKAIAKKMQITIVSLSQLSRKVEERSDKKPVLSDLRESGAIEQDADIVIFIYRPEYYGVMEYADGGGSTVGTAEIILAKYRNGNPCPIQVGFRAELTEFYNLGEDEPPRYEDPPPRTNTSKLGGYKDPTQSTREVADEDLPF